jgi:hypothetical protein
MDIFLGSHGVGKSTLLLEIEKIDKDYPIFEGVSRPLSKGLKVAGIKLSDEVRQGILNELDIAQQINFSRVKQGLATRSVIDSIFYSKHLIPEMDMTDLEETWERTRRGIRYIFHIPIEFPLEGDEVRKGVWTIPSVQKEISDNMYNFVLNEIKEGRFPKENLITVKGTVEERLTILKKYI